MQQSLSSRAWRTVALGDIAQIVGGSTPRTGHDEYWGGNIPWVTPTDLPKPGEGIAAVKNTAATITELGLASSSTQIVPAGTVLYSTRATIGKIGIAEVPLTTNQGFANFVPRPFVDARFLAYALIHHTPAIASMAGSTTFKEVSKGALKGFIILLPSLSEQRQIVEILDQADGLRRKCSAVEEISERVLPALFRWMFGDPATNPMEWQLEKVGKLCRIVSGATPRTDHPEFFGGDIAWATPKDLSGLQDFVLERTERSLTEVGYKSCSAQILPAGAVLFSSRAPIGLVALAGTEVCTNQGFKSFVCGSYLEPWYLFSWLRLRREFIDGLGRGATFKEVSTSIVSQIEVPVPPIELQQEFSRNIQKWRHIRLLTLSNKRNMDGLWISLLRCAFSGNLTAKWREERMQELLQEMEVQTLL